jgi:hypothetical protein
MHNIKSITQKDRYGNMFSLEMFEDQGVPMMMMIPDMADGYNGGDTDNHPGNPKGTDTVPAWLTPGENVVNAEASRIPGNQEKIDQMNDQGRQMQAAQGGPIPSYAADGGMIPQYHAEGSVDWITNNLLDRIKMTESGGKHRQDDGKLTTSSAGAVGAYQWMPASAADPGYGVEGFDPTKVTEDEMRNKTQEYLVGIQRAHPEWSKEDVLRAYNAGPGRIEDSKRGPGVPLPDETLAYSNKVLGAETSVKPELNSADQIKRAFMYPLEFAGLPVDDDAPGVPNVFKEPDRTSSQEFDLKAARVNQANAIEDLAEMEERKAAGLPINEKTYEGLKQRVEFQNAQVNSAQDKLGIIRDVIAKTDTGDEPDQPPVDNKNKQNVTGTGVQKAKEDPGFLDDTINLFKEVLGDMFSGKDIARMAINYIGSRAMGYEHNGSLNYAMKDFADRAETQQKQEFELIKANADSYDSASYNEYIMTGNKDVLKPRSADPNQRSGQAYLRGVGRVSIYKDSKTKDEYVRIGGKNISISKLADHLEPWEESVHGRGKALSTFKDAVKDSAATLNDQYGLRSGRKDDNTFDTRVKVNETGIATKAESRYREILHNNGMSLRDAPELMIKVQSGVNKYIEDTIKYEQQRKAGNKDVRKPISVRAYIDAETRLQLTGVPQAAIGDTSVSNMNTLDNKIKKGMSVKNPRESMMIDGKEITYQQDYINQWMATYAAWNKVAVDNQDVFDKYKRQAEKMRDKDDKQANQWSAYTLWLNDTSPKEIREIVMTL